MTNDHGLLVLLARIIAGNLRTAGAVRVCEPGRDMKVDGYGMSERIMKMVDDKPPDVHPRCISEGRIRKLIYCSQPGGELVVDGIALTPGLPCTAAHGSAALRWAALRASTATTSGLTDPTVRAAVIPAITSTAARCRCSRRTSINA